MTAATNTPLTGQLPYAGYGIWYGSGDWYFFQAPGARGGIHLDINTDSDTVAWEHHVTFTDEHGRHTETIEALDGCTHTQVEAMAVVLQGVRANTVAYKVGEMPDNGDEDEPGQYDEI